MSTELRKDLGQEETGRPTVVLPLPLPWGNTSFQADGLVSKDLLNRLVAQLDKAQEEEDEENQKAKEEGGGELLPSSNNAGTGKLERVSVNLDSGETITNSDQETEEDGGGKCNNKQQQQPRRLVHRLNFIDDDLAKELCQTLAPALPSRLSVDCVAGTCTHVDGVETPFSSLMTKSRRQEEEGKSPSPTYDTHMGPFAGGEWKLHGVDSHIQLFRYPVGGVFSQHRDGPRYYSADRRTFFTVLIYLNDSYEGGRTTVFTDAETPTQEGEEGEKHSNYSVEPKQGRVFVMLQRTLHQGGEVVQGVKDALRCDILYHRMEEEEEEGVAALKSPPPTFSSASMSIAHLTKEGKARQWCDLGLQLEASGQLNGAVECYQRATKLDPSIM